MEEVLNQSGATKKLPNKTLEVKGKTVGNKCKLFSRNSKEQSKQWRKMENGEEEEEESNG